ncbi:MAG: cyclic pyranopterin monophosphate synthase MoaC [Actinobacteria bacterium]|nr:cyclic pyranopterin monophosphate synthase MoaC [Actinomycetota bacterium]MBU1944737.1 cyclic pyranopterin monophosphate synthase MoaC [Actinomycetota bacterium]MBU2688418.1 cyclic pyranopterin monophosphate synthase MoaC [Actinomycetota bacterium]
MPEEPGAGDGLSHLDSSGAARMVDVGAKPVTSRQARAGAWVEMSPSTLDLIASGDVPKGDVFSAARIAGIMAAKNTHHLVPLCHALKIDSVSVEFEVDRPGSRLGIQAVARASDRTGVEMEALLAVSIAALTVYDMCKAVDRGMEITGVRLMSKSGGRSGAWEREER